MTRGRQLGIRKHDADRGEGTHVEVTTYEVRHCAPAFRREGIGDAQWMHHVSWPQTLWTCTEQNVTVGVPDRDRTTEQGANNE